MEEYEIIEPVPEPESLSCKLTAFLLAFCLYALPFVLGVFGYMKYDWFIGVCFFAFGYLINGIIHSKLRLLCIPKDQLQNSFTTVEVAKWFVSNYIGCK